jgi:hypothetical protein
MADLKTAFSNIVNDVFNKQPVERDSKALKRLKNLEKQLVPILEKLVSYENLLYVYIPELEKCPFEILEKHSFYKELDRKKIEIEIDRLYLMNFKGKNMYYKEINEELLRIILKIDNLASSETWNETDKSVRKKTIKNIQELLLHNDRINVLLKNIKMN